MYFNYLFIRIIVLVISFSAYVVNLSYFLVKCFLVSILNLVAFFAHCLPRILLNIGSVYVTGFAKTWL